MRRLRSDHSAVKAIFENQSMPYPVATGHATSASPASPAAIHLIR